MRIILFGISGGNIKVIPNPIPFGLLGMSAITCTTLNRKKYFVCLCNLIGIPIRQYLDQTLGNILPLCGWGLGASPNMIAVLW